MEKALKMFLLAVEDNNFTKAAMRAHVTQQCLSSHIKCLEDELSVNLFERRPQLKLTAAGEALYLSARQIELIEGDLSMRLKEIQNGTVGHIRIGINTTRGSIVLPSLFDEYHKIFPKVTISVILDDTVNLVQLLHEKKLDLFLGIDCVPNEFLELYPVKQEPMFLVATNEVLKNCYSGQKVWEDLHGGETLDLHDFGTLPITGNLGSSTACELINRYLLSKNVQFQRIFSVGDYGIQTKLCGRNIAAMFCSLLLLDTIIDYNQRNPRHGTLLIFRVKELTETLRVDIVKQKQLFTPKYQQCFIEYLQKRLDDYYNKIEKILPEQHHIYSCEKK